jgi:polysaccharide biosynthesis protein PslH
LYVSPVIPSFTGNGLAMRAGAVLEALARSYRVSVLTTPLRASREKQMPPALRQLCEQAIEIPVAQIGRPAGYEGRFFDAVHVFRLASLGAAKPFLKKDCSRVRCLDLDDVESKTCRRIAALYRDDGQETRVRDYEAAARNAEMLEVVAFRTFDRIYVCSEADRQELQPRCRAEVCVLPNVVRPPAVSDVPAAEGNWRFLFVGALGYYPNEDAIAYFCTRILPRIRESAGCPVELTIAGSGLSTRLHDIVRGTGIHTPGHVPDLAPVYQAAGAAIVPIRAGGGTRIKILEAFAYGRPVVTTTIGAEGIDAVPGEHLLIGDTPEAFADCCVRIMTDRSVRERLVANARELVRRYTIESLHRTIVGFRDSRRS